MGIVTSPLFRTGAPDGHAEPSPSADDRGRDGPQSLAGDAAILSLRRREVQPPFRRAAGSARHGAGPRLPAPSDRPEALMVAHQPGRVRPALERTRTGRKKPGRPVILFLERLQAAFEAGDLTFFGDLTRLREPSTFGAHIEPLRSVEWVVYAKRPFGGPRQVLDYLGRYTHRVALANSRLLACENGRVRFRWKDHRARHKGKAMTLDAGEFIRRFLLHVLPRGFRRIRHFGFLANACRTAKLAQIRTALEAPDPPLPAK